MANGDRRPVGTGAAEAELGQVLDERIVQAQLAGSA
jgi:hypothetical protein